MRAPHAFAAGLLLLGTSLSAQDLPGSAACRAALQALSQAEEALIAASAASAPATADADRQRAVTARLLPLRQRVADVCLGGMTTSPPPSQHTWIGEMPTRPGSRAAPEVRMPQINVPVVTIPPPRFEPPVTVTCNGMSCVASDGSALTRIGPNVIGPKGPCSLAGAQVRCP